MKVRTGLISGIMQRYSTASINKPPLYCHEPETGISRGTHAPAGQKQTLVAMLGVTFGISMFIVMISFMTGVNDFLDIAIDGSPHVRLYNPIESSQPSPPRNCTTAAAPLW